MAKHLLVDFGEVISTAQPAVAVRGMAALMGMPTGTFAEQYWAHRAAYDLGQPAHEYWGDVVGRPVRSAELVAVRNLDLESWTHLNFATINALRSAARNGCTLTMLSNAPHDLAKAVGRNSVLSEIFSLFLFSAELRLAKPSAEIFEVALALTESTPDETLFIDDRAENVLAAAALGIRTHLFTAAEQLDEALRTANSSHARQARASRPRSSLLQPAHN